MFCAVAAVADTAADAVMLRKKPEAQPAHSFLEDVAPVKEIKAEEKKPEVKPEVKVPEEKAEVKAEVKAEEPKPEVRAEAKTPEVKAEEKKPEVTFEKEAESVPEAKPEKPKKDKSEKKEKKPVRDAVITADRTDYDRKEGVVLFDRNVYVDDEQYQMHADRLFLFLDGTNDLKRLVAIGHVAITNEDKRAYCARATFNKKLGRVVMYSSDEITAQLREEGKKGSDVKGEKITFWLDSEQVEVENPVITMPGGFGGQENMKKLIGK